MLHVKDAGIVWASSKLVQVVKFLGSGRNVGLVRLRFASVDVWPWRVGVQPGVLREESWLRPAVRFVPLGSLRRHRMNRSRRQSSSFPSNRVKSPVVSIMTSRVSPSTSPIRACMASKLCS